MSPPQTRHTRSRERRSTRPPHGELEAVRPVERQRRPSVSSGTTPSSTDPGPLPEHGHKGSPTPRQSQTICTK